MGADTGACVGSVLFGSNSTGSTVRAAALGWPPRRASWAANAAAGKAAGSETLGDEAFVTAEGLMPAEVAAKALATIDDELTEGKTGASHSTDAAAPGKAERARNKSKPKACKYERRLGSFNACACTA